MPCDAGFLPGHPPRWSLTSSAALFVNRFGNCGLGRPQKNLLKMWVNHSLQPNKALRSLLEDSPLRNWKAALNVCRKAYPSGSLISSRTWKSKKVYWLVVSTHLKNIRQNGFNLPQRGNWRWFHQADQVGPGGLSWSCDERMNSVQKRSFLIQRFESTTYKWCIYGCNLQTEPCKSLKRKKTEDCTSSKSRKWKENWG